MEYKKLNSNWNAEPNAPEVRLFIDDLTVKLDFFLNHFVFSEFKENERGVLTFFKVHKFSFNTTNSDGYYMDQYRYKNSDLPWGEFYQLNTKWQIDFHENVTVLFPQPDETNLKHFIFFLRDNTFECVAEGFEFTSGYFIKGN